MRNLFFLIAYLETQRVCPAHIILYDTRLHAVELIIQLLGNGAYIAVSYLHVFAVDVQLANGRDHRSRTG